MAAMLTLKSIADFRRDPDRSYVVGSQWLYFTFGPDISGFALWGHVDGTAIDGLTALMELELDREPHAGFVDAARVESFSAEAFARLGRYVVQHSARLTKIITQTAMVLPGGLMGAIAAGFFQATASPFRVTHWRDALEGFHDLKCAQAHAYATALASVIRSAQGTDPLLLAVRSYVGSHLVKASLPEAARVTGNSVRTIQRRLAVLNTSFADEVQNARMTAAKRLLTETDEPLIRIAYDSGCSSPQHFSTLFRKTYGETPSDYRKRSGSHSTPPSPRRPARLGGREQDPT